MPSTSKGTRGSVRPFKGHTAPAFTLIELLATVFIIGLLMAILIPRFAFARQQAKRSACLSHERTVALALISHANQNNDFLPAPGAKVEVDGVKISPRELLYRPQVSLINLGVLVENELPDDYSNFFCPSATLANFLQDVKLIGGGVSICGDYSYGLSIPPEQRKSVSNTGSVAILSDNFVGSSMGKDIGLGHFAHKTGYNVAFTDGSGFYFRDPKGKYAGEKIAYDDEDDPFTFAELEPDGRAPDKAPKTMRIYEIWHDLSFVQSAE